MRFKTNLISDMWDEKLLTKGGPAADSVKQKAEIELDIDESLNQTLPYIGFIKKISKQSALFEMELVSEKGYYYRVAFSRNQTEDNPKKDGVSNNTRIPDTQDVYCEIRIITPSVKP